MDNLMIWNIRGLNSPNKQLELQVVSRKYGIGLLGIVENKLNATTVEACKMKWFTDWLSVHNFSGTMRSRIWLIWHPQWFQVDTLSVGSQWIHTRVRRLSTKETFI